MLRAREPLARGSALGLAAALLLVAAAGCRPIAPPPRPNLVLVTVDTLRADHLGAYGAALADTPTLDALAREGVRFETAVSPAPLTLPAHASLFTALDPPRHGVRHNGIFALDAALTTLPERLRKAGYRTGAVVGAFVLSRRFGLDQGFDRYDESGLWRPAAPGGALERSAREVTDAALAWLEETPDPYFLWVHYFDPHARYQPPEPFASRFAESPYAGEIAYVDHELGRLLAHPRLAEALLVVTADHGESLGEHGEETHSYTLYDATQRVPLLWHGPGLPRGRVLGGVARLVDVAPTLLELLGLDPLPESDGRPLPLLADEDGSLADRLAYAETLAPRLDHGLPALYAVRSARFLYVRGARRELYDLRVDPHQTRELLSRAPAPPVALTRFEREIERAQQRARGGSSLALSTGEQQRLRALGYAVPAAAPPGALDASTSEGLRLFEAARAAFGAGELEKAEALARRGLEKLPQSSELHALLGRITLELGRTEDAVAELERAVVLAPRSALFRSLLGDARLARGELDAALAAWEAALERDPALAPAHAGRVWKLLRGGELRDALAHAARARELQPGSPEIERRLSLAFAAAGRTGPALEAARRWLALAPESPLAHLQLALVLAQLGELDEALTLSGEGPPKAAAPAAWNRLAVALAEHGAAEEAARIWRELLSVEGASRVAEQNLAALGQPPAAPAR